MSDTYCPCCRDVTETVEEFVDGGKQYVCEVCGTIVEECPIRNPSSPGNPFGDNATQEHWSGTFQPTPNPASFSLLRALQQEDSAAGRRIRRSAGVKKSCTLGSIDASLRNVVSKLGLHESFLKRALEFWNSARNGAGLVGTPVRRDYAPAVGMACVLWICRDEGLDITTETLAKVSGLRKRDILSALMKVMKVRGAPCCKKSNVDFLGPETKPVHGVEEALGKIRSRVTPKHFEETQVLATALWKMELFSVEDCCELVVICAFVLRDKFIKSRTTVKMQDFCRRYGLPFGRSMEVLEIKVRTLLDALAARLAPAQAREGKRDYRIYDVYDIVNLMEQMDSDDFPEVGKQLLS